MSQKHELFTKQGQKWQITNYGEFVSYYHSHVQILDNLLESQEEDSNEINQKKKNLRKFMKDNIRNINHFIESSDKLAEFVSMTSEDFNQYMMENFLPILEKIQKTMKKQFVEKVYLEEQENFFNENIIEGILKNTIFSFEDKKFQNEDKLFSIQELKTGKKFISLSLKKEKKAQLEAQDISNAKEKVEIREREPEIQILDEIVTKFENLLTGEKLVLKSKIIDEEHSPKEQIKKSDNLISDFDELEFEQDNEIESEATETEDFIEEDVQPQIQNILKEENITQNQDILKEEEEEKEEDIQPQIQNILKEENIAQNQILTEDIKETKEDFISLFEYIRLLNLNKKNKKTDIKNYKKWLISLEDTKRSIIFIQDLLEKDLKQSIEWTFSLKKVSQNIKVDYNELKQIKDSILFLFQIKRELEVFWKICHKDYPSVVPVFKNAWNSLLKIFSSNIKNKKIDFNTVEQKILHLLKEDNQKTLRKILQNWLESRLKKQTES